MRVTLVELPQAVVSRYTVRTVPAKFFAPILWT
jgi:hypothetical protein